MTAEDRVREFFNAHPCEAGTYIGHVAREAKRLLNSPVPSRDAIDTAFALTSMPDGYPAAELPTSFEVNLIHILLGD